MYNDRDQLVSETQKGGPVHTYHDDANGAQTLKTGDGPDQLFGWDLRERVGDDPSATTLDRSYLNGRQIEGQADASGFGFFMRDAHGSNRGLLRRTTPADAMTAPATMAAWERYDFQAFGEPVKLWSADVGTGGGDFASPGDARTTHLHAGDGEYAASVGLYYNDARFRDRFRFVSRDPTIFGPGQTLDANLYRYAGGNAVGYNDPTGRWTVLGVLTALTVGTTAMSLALPVLATGYLAATGKVSVRKVLTHLGDLDIWAGAAVGMGIGAGASVAMQKLLLKAGQEAVKRVTPGIGLVFAGIGLYQSIGLTRQLLAGQLPKVDAERTIAMMIAGNIISVLLAVKMPKWARDAESKKSQDYFALSPDEQVKYNVGAQLLPRAVFDPLKHLSEVDRGNELLRSFTRSERWLLRLQGLWETFLNFGTPGEFNTVRWVGTGLTPELQLYLGTNGSTTQGMMNAALMFFSDPDDR